jgi:hypothetical protein
LAFRDFAWAARREIFSAFTWNALPLICIDIVKAGAEFPHPSRSASAGQE